MFRYIRLQVVCKPPAVDSSTFQHTPTKNSRETAVAMPLRLTLAFQLADPLQCSVASSLGLICGIQGDKKGMFLWAAHQDVKTYHACENNSKSLKSEIRQNGMYLLANFHSFVPTYSQISTNLARIHRIHSRIPYLSGLQSSSFDKSKVSIVWPVLSAHGSARHPLYTKQP